MSKRQAFLLDLGDDEAAELLLGNLDEYIGLLGWTRKRFYLMGAAAVIGRNNDNNDLVVQIAEYLAGNKPYGKRKK
jgi:hypothetical protein